LAAIAFAVEPQQPHYKDGEHNPKYAGEHEQSERSITRCIIESCSG